MNYKHGKCNSREYLSWGSMKSRCLNPNDRAFHNYGARGITVDPEWNDFNRFLSDMGPCPDGMTLDRIDNEQGYSKDNCRWASRTTQSRNRRSVHSITTPCGQMTVTEAVERFGAVSAPTAYARIENGWDPFKAVTTPKITNRKGQRGSEDVSRNSAGEAVVICGHKVAVSVLNTSVVSYQTLVARLRKGWPLQEALSLPALRGRRIKHGVRFNHTEPVPSQGSADGGGASSLPVSIT